MPAYLNENINDGFDLAQILRKRLPDVKIVISTMHTSPLYLYSIIEKVKPEGFLIKADIDGSDIIKALENAFAVNSYYSKTVIEAVKTISQFSFCHDELNRTILLLTEKRYTNKEISQQLKASESTIEKRKAIIKQHLSIEGQNDRQMINILNNLNFL